MQMTNEDLNKRLDSLNLMIEQEKYDKAKNEIQKIKDELSKEEDHVADYIDDLVDELK